MPYCIGKLPEFYTIITPFSYKIGNSTKYF